MSPSSRWLKWHWKLCGCDSESGVSLQTPKASPAFSANGDHTHISLYNLTHYRKVSWAPLVLCSQKGKCYLVRTLRNLRRGPIWNYLTVQTWCWCLSIQANFLILQETPSFVMSVHGDSGRAYRDEGNLLVTHKETVSKEWYDFLIYIWRIHFFLSFNGKNHICCGLFEVGPGFRISSMSPVLISGSTHPNH